jgi:hypothetical protein
VLATGILSSLELWAFNLQSTPKFRKETSEGWIRCHIVVKCRKFLHSALYNRHQVKPVLDKEIFDILLILKDAGKGLVGEWVLSRKYLRQYKNLRRDITDLLKLHTYFHWDKFFINCLSNDLD